MIFKTCYRTKVGKLPGLGPVFLGSGFFTGPRRYEIYKSIIMLFQQVSNVTDYREYSDQ